MLTEKEAQPDAVTESIRDKGGCHSFGVWALATIRRLEAENERLRGALAGLIKSAERWEYMTERKFFALHESDNFNRAKSALEEKPE